MSKKAKGVVLGGFSPMSLDAKARCKSQTLLLEYQDLQKETYGVRMKLDSAKQRRGELLAEVRFLRKRHRYLVKIKSMERQAEQQSNIPQQSHIENPIELTTKGRKLHKSEAARFKLPPLPEKPKGRDYARITSKNVSSSSLATNNKLASQSVNWMDVASQHNLKDVNYRKRVSRDNNTAFRDTFHLIETENFQSGGGNVTMSKTPTLDLNLDNGGVVRKEETVLPTRIPTFDLNEVSMEEDEVIQVGGDEQARSEESRRSVIRAGYDEQVNDMKISSSVCRNNSGEGGGGPSRIGKRKISWQDPVALRV